MDQGVIACAAVLKPSCTKPLHHGVFCARAAVYITAAPLHKLLQTDPDIDPRRRRENKWPARASASKRRR